MSRTEAFLMSLITGVVLLAVLFIWGTIQALSSIGFVW